MINVTPFIDQLPRKTVGVFGLGASGLATIQAVVKAGGKVMAWDDKEEARQEAEKLDANVKELTSEALKKCDILVIAPGVPLTHPEPHPVVRAAKDLDLEVIGDIEVFHRSCPNVYTIGLTGTNGKSTTTTLIHHILKECGKKTLLGGNIGLPVLKMAQPKKDTIVVLELSSFQIDLCPTYAPDTGVLLNITPDHIDRHGSIENYAGIKERVFSKPSGHNVIAVDDDFTREICERLNQHETKKTTPVSVEKELTGGIFVKDGVLVDNSDNLHEEIGSISNITKLHGLHNMQNTAVAYAVTENFGLDHADILQAISIYPGLPHRQFPVRVISGVAYINDSKATNAEATSKALGCQKNIYWILGGKQKDGGLDGLEQYMDRVNHAYLIGEAASDFSKWLEKYGVEYTISGTLDSAVKQAHEAAQADRGQPGGGGVVLLSPACASFDQFESFEARGDAFTEYVEALSEDDAA